MCNSKRSNRFRNTSCGSTPPLLPRHGQLLSLESFMKELVLAPDDASQRELIIVDDNAKFQDSSKIVTILRARGGDADDISAVSSPPSPVTPVRKVLSRWDSGESKTFFAGKRSTSSLCAPVCPRKPRECDLSPRKPEEDQRPRRRVTFSLPCNISPEEPHSTNVLTRMFAPKQSKEPSTDISFPPKKPRDHQKSRRKVTFSHISKHPSIKSKSTFSLLEAIFEHGSFSEMSSEDFSIS